jgi:hypothetical protein
MMATTTNRRTIMKAAERYGQLVPHREQFLQRARHNAMLTIPSLMPLEGHDGKSHMIEPYQSLGATGVMAMASRLTMALIPAGRPHLRLAIPPQILMKMEGEVSPETNQMLAKAESLVQASAERANWRAATLEGTQQLLVVGSIVEETLEDDTIRLHRLDNFVWRRDFRGNMLECVLREFWDRNSIPEEVRPPAATNTALMARDAEDIEVFTLIRLMTRGDNEFYEVETQLGTGEIIREKKEFEPAALRYRFLRWSATPGEDYGRSKTEDIVGDLRSLDSLTKQALEISAMGAKHFTMVRPGATANGLKNRLTRVRNGDVVLGDFESVEMKQFQISSGYQVLADQITKLEERISRAFLLLSGGAQRNAERVTATEIERDVQELEATLGGVFSTLSLEMLEKRTELLIEDMKAREEFPQIEREELQVVILTGLEALSRERDVSRGVQAAQILNQFGEEGVARTKLNVILDKILVGLGFPDAVKSEAEFQQEQQARQQAQMAQDVMSKAAGPLAGAAAKGDQGGEQQ